MKKALIIIFSVIIILIVAGMALYKPVYDFVAPKVFDHFVGKNLQRLIDNPEDNININSQDDSVKINPQDDSSEVSDEEKESLEKDEEKKDGDVESDMSEKKSESNEKSESKGKKKNVYKSNTHIGEVDEYDLNYILKVITPGDKTRIISIIQGCVAKSDYPEMARRIKDGLDHADMAYIESYLRSHLTPQQKEQILNIVAKYVNK